MAKSSAAVGKGGAATLFAVLDPPPPLVFSFSNQRDVAFRNGVSIDLRVSAATTTPDVTRLWAGGATAVAGQSLNVDANPMSTSPTDGEDVQVATGGEGRFLARLGDSKHLLRNNYLVSVALGGTFTSLPFAIR